MLVYSEKSSFLSTGIQRPFDVCWMFKFFRENSMILYLLNDVLTWPLNLAHGAVKDIFIWKELNICVSGTFVLHLHVTHNICPPFLGSLQFLFSAGRLRLLSCTGFLHFPDHVVVKHSPISKIQHYILLFKSWNSLPWINIFRFDKCFKGLQSWSRVSTYDVTNLLPLYPSPHKIFHSSF